MRTIKGLAAGAVIAGAVACGGGAEDGCAAEFDCPEGQSCVLLSAGATRGVCVAPDYRDPRPGALLHADFVVQRQLDVLFVVDDGPAIAGRAEQVGAAAAAFVAAIEAKRPRAELRVAFTSTAIEHPLCAGPVEVGALATSSCRERLDAFTAEIDGATVDAQAACTDGCTLGQLGLRPTTTARDDAARVRPWFEVDPWGTGNLPEGVSLADAVRCAAPQGIAGCRFGGPLEATRRALERIQTEGDPAYGFLRDGADLLVVMISAGNDCSVRPGAEEVFVDDPVFWGDLMPPDLTPGVCWRAGVVCEGPGPAYAGCEAQDLGLDGLPTTPASASLRPASEVVAALAGFLREHGIGPGCAGSGLRAPPPVRALAGAAFEANAQAVPRASSVCATDWTADMTALGEAFAENVPPSCFGNCAVDTDTATAGLQAFCEVARVDLLASTRVMLPACEVVGAELQIPEGAPACFQVRTDDAIDPRCAAEGYNVEFEVVTAAADPPGVSYSSGCRLSADKAKDCPLL